MQLSSSNSLAYTSRRKTSSTATLACIAAAIAGAASSPNVWGAQIPETWNGGTGTWETAGNWTPGTVPDNGGGNTYIAQINVISSIVNMNASHTIDALTIGTGNALNIANNTNLSIVAGPISNGGSLNINSVGNTTSLVIGAANISLTGGGNVILSDNVNNLIFGSAAADVLTNVNNTISGAGNIGDNQMALNNQGTINATGTNALTIQTNNGTTNTGTLEATTTLVIDGYTVNNTGGTIKALNGGNVDLENSVTIAGGILTTAGTGVIHTLGGQNSTLDGSANTLTNNGVYQLDNNATTTLEGTIANNATINLASGGNSTRLVIGSANVTLNGGGSVTLSDNVNNLIYGSAAADVLTNVNNTISGAGNIGDNQMALNNQGIINATGTTTLTIQTSNGTTNTGTLEATTTLIIYGNTVNNVGGTIQALNGGNLYLEDGVTIAGGLLTTAGTGIIHTPSGHNAILDGSTHTVTIGGNYQVDNNGSTTLKGTIINNGTIQQASIGNSTDLIISGNVTLQGSGTVTMSNNSNNRIYGVSENSTDTLNIQQTIQGGGLLGMGWTILNNQSTIDANVATPLVVVAGAVTNATSTNTGTMEASSASTLEIAGTFDNTNGLIAALNGVMTGGTVLLNGATIKNGTLTATGNGTISPNNTATLQNLTISGTGSYALPNNTNTTLIGTITNNSTIQVGSGGSDTDLIISGTVTLQGSGTVTMDNNGNNRIYGAAQNSTDILNIQQPIQGGGQVGLGLTILNNQNTINANAANAHLVVIAGAIAHATSTNTGTMEASSGSVLEVAGTFDNTSGHITALAGGTVLLDSPTIENGTLTATGTGTISPSNAATLQNLTISGTGTYTLPNNTSTTLVGTINNNSAVQLNSAGSNTDLNISGNVTLQGSGTVTMSNNGNNRIYGLVAADILTLKQAVQGAGQIGVGQMTLANQSTINANASTSLLVFVSGNASTNIGTMEASNASTLQLRGVFDNTSGSITALAGGTVLLNGASISNGTLNTTTTGTISPNNTATLSNLTIIGSGAYAVSNNTSTTLLGTIVNNSTIALGSVGNTTDLIAGAGGLILTGTGSVTMSNNTNNRFYAASGQTLTLQQPVQGAGQIGVAQTVLVNQSIIDANLAQPLTVSVLGTATNNGGIMEANNGSVLALVGTYDNTNGLITAINGTVQLNGASISNGTLNATGTGTISPNNSATLTNVTITGTGSYSVVNNTSTTLVGTITNMGNITMNSAGNTTDLIISGAVSLQGGGTVTMSNNANNRFYSSANSTLTNVNNLIQGAGQLGVGQTTIVNDAGGTISADQSNALILTPGAGGVSNMGTFQAINGATLTVNGPGTHTGNFNTAANSTMNFNGTQTFNSGATLSSGNYNFSNGTVTFNTGASANGANLNFGAVTINLNSGLNLNAATVTTQSNTTLNFTLVTPGASSVNGAIHVTGNNGLTLNGGTVAFPNHSTGAASLGYYKLLSYSGAIGGSGVAGLTVTTSSAETAAHIVYYLYTSHDAGFVDVHRGLLGDANDDGLVNFADFVVLSNHFTATNAGWGGADFNNDGVTNFADFVILSNNFGGTIGANAVAIAPGNVSGVPEPGTLLLLGAGFLSALGRRRQQRHLAGEGSIRRYQPAIRKQG